eukprot:TRINITY_DN1279_c0_g1_i4.p1 TRINITY_DN1279_c0_g1~~TRINITY_DN1279_c0_g1_i4.p1  ORF type:complete len:632 (+),score=82.66 TRINITY_DN1279_c0_g1_i4:80-1975(+)
MSVARRRASAASSVSMLTLLIFVGGCAIADARNFKKQIKAAKKRGLSGYKLIDELDIWFGDQSPDVGVVWKQLDEIGNGDKKVTMKDWLAAGLPQAHFTYFDTDKNGKLDVHEAHSWHQQRQPAQTMNLSEVDDPPRGHHQPLGSWKDPLPTDDLIYHKPYPHPRDFWRKHMDGYLPALLKGAQEGQPAMKWTPDVLRERFGWVDVKLEPKIETRDNDTGYIDLDAISPTHRLNISEFLRLEKNKNIYVVSVLPQPMAWEVAHPSVLLCGSRRKIVDKRSSPPYKIRDDHPYPHEQGYSWMTHLFEANLWMGTGTTRSQLHYDKEWNVNCLLSGTKRWFFLDPFSHHENLQWSRGKKFKPNDPLNNAWTDWVYLNPDHVDLIVQNKLRNMDYFELIQEAGDCVFIPYAMLHQVQKLDPGFQVAVSWMFLPETVYDEEACKEAPIDTDIPLSVMDTMYMYSGKGIIPQGYADPLNFVKLLKESMQQQRSEHLTLPIFTAVVTQGEAILRFAKDKNERIKKMYKLILEYASDPKRGLSVKELNKVPLRIWCKPAAEGDAEGPLPCDDGEEYILPKDEEISRMEKYLEERLAAVSGGKESKGSTATGEFPTHTRIWNGDRRRGRGESALKRTEL